MGSSLTAQKVADALGCLRKKDKAAGLVGFVTNALDRVTESPHDHIMVFAWAVARLCHKFGMTREAMHDLVDKAWDYSVNYDRKDAN